MFDEALVAMVTETAGKLVADAEAAVGLAKQQHTAVAGKVTSAEIRRHTALTNGRKSESLLETLCHRSFRG